MSECGFSEGGYASRIMFVGNITDILATRLFVNDFLFQFYYIILGKICILIYKIYISFKMKADGFMK